MDGPLFTIGHSNRTLEAFLALLHANQVELLVDVRAFPGSRRLPHFGQPVLEPTLASESVDYLHRPDLGGRRKSDALLSAQGLGDGWRNSSFRAYAEYAQSQPYDVALEDLIARAARQRVAIMCSEAVPWRCHRWLISDTLLARGVQVVHIVGTASPRLHQLSPFAVVDAGRVTWPGPPSAASLSLGPPVSAS